MSIHRRFFAGIEKILMDAYDVISDSSMPTTDGPSVVNMTSNGRIVTSENLTPSDGNWENIDTLSMSYFVILNNSDVLENVYVYVDPTLSRSFYYARLVIVCATMVTFAWGFSGNTLVLYVVGRHANIRVKSVANYYIWNLAMADILYVLALPLTGFVTYTDSWPFSDLLGTVSCKLAYVFRETTRYASTYTLAILTVDRCLASYSNLRRFRAIRYGKAVCVAIWTCSLVATTPLIVFAEAITYENANGSSTRCATVWPSEGTATSDLSYIIPWTAIDNIFIFLVPTFVIVVSYVHLFRRLRHLSAAARGGMAAHLHRQRHTPTDGNDVIAESTAPERTLRSPITGAAGRRGKMVRTVMVAVITHVTLQLPYHVTQVISVERTAKLMTTGQLAFSAIGLHAFMWSSAIAQILVFASSCCNPVIYGITNENFRRLYASTLCYSIPCRQRPHRETDQPRADPRHLADSSGQRRRSNDYSPPMVAGGNHDVNFSRIEPVGCPTRSPSLTVDSKRRRVASDVGIVSVGGSVNRIQFRMFCHAPCTPSAAKRRQRDWHAVEPVVTVSGVSRTESGGRDTVLFRQPEVTSTLL